MGEEGPCRPPSRSPSSSRAGSITTVSPPGTSPNLVLAGARLTGTELPPTQAADGRLVRAASANCIGRPRSGSGQGKHAASLEANPAGGGLLGPRDEHFEFLRAHAKVLSLEEDKQLILAEPHSAPGQLVAYRSAAARDRSPERLHLDRRGLVRCPQLQSEEQLRLVDYQCNRITRIENLSSLPNLVFLDLYNNKVKRIENLEPVQNLRVLILGKNQVGRVESLDALSKLDTLDLHSNRITEIENLSCLRELRVLNLAGNHLQRLENLSGLSGLTELNVRRNRLASAAGIEVLGRLERLFISHNWITDFAGVEPLGCLGSLSELELEGNPFCEASGYWAQVVSSCTRLQQLDGKEVKRTFGAKQRSSRGADGAAVAARPSSGAGPPLKRDASLPFSRPSSRAGERGSRSTAPGPDCRSRQPAYPQALPPWGRSVGQGAGGAAPVGRCASSSPSIPMCRGNAAGQAQRGSLDGEVLREIRQQWQEAVGQGRGAPATRAYLVRQDQPSELSLFGVGSLEALDRPDCQASVSSLQLNFVAVESLASEVSRIAKLDRLSSLHLSFNQIVSVHQLDALRRLPSLEHLSIASNPVCSLRSNVRLWMIRLLPGLQLVNGRAVSESEREAAGRLFRPLERFVGKASPFCVPGSEESRMDKGPELQSDSVIAIVDGVVAHAISADERARAVHDCFEAAIGDAAQEAWEEALALEDLAFDDVW